MFFVNYLNSIYPKKKPKDLGIVTRALGTYIDPYHPDGYRGNISGTDIDDSKYPCIVPGNDLTLYPSESPAGSLNLYTLPTKYYSDGGASIEAISPYYYFGGGSLASVVLGHASIWIKPYSTIDKTTTLQVPLLFDYNPNNDGCLYLGLGSATGLLTDEYITIVDTGYETEGGGGPRTNRRTGVTTGGALTGNQWVNISINWDSVNSRYDILVNNVECSGYIASTGPYSGHVKQHTMPQVQLGLGALFGDNGNGRNFFNGRISAYTQYTDSLTIQEMTDNFNFFKARFGL
jgi:hypothetical protein